MAGPASQPIRWEVTYHSFLVRCPLATLDRGFLYLHHEGLRLVLLDADGLTVDARFLKQGEKVIQGSEIELPCHLVKVGVQDLPASQDPQVTAAWPFWQPFHPGPQAHDNPPVNLASQQIQHILGNQILDLNHAPPNVAFDLNAEPHQLDHDDFLELNDLINPVIQNHGPPLVVMGLPAPVQAQAQDVDMLPIEDNHSDLTLTISSVATHSDESGGSINGGPHNAQLPNLHIGMMLILEVEVDPIAALSPVYGTGPLAATHCSESADFWLSKEGTATWSTHFKPDGSIVNTVNVPAKWVDFITAKLLTPEDFGWAKGLLQSKIWEILTDFEIKSDGSARPFVLPRCCPTQAPPVCTLTLACEKATQGFMTPQAPRKDLIALSHSSTSAIHFKKKGQKTPLVCSEVRRSSRIKAMNKGYKAKTCFDKNCLACAAVGPSKKKSVVTNLCSRFNIPEESEAGESTENEEETIPVVPTGKKQKHSTNSCANASTKKNPKKK
ncbi:hypothetical protein ACQ4PT_031286 [Festuca glaucescens]